LWGAATVTVFAFASLYEPTVISHVCGAQNKSFSGCFSIVFHLHAIGAGPTIHLAFLRDLFVCMLIAPLLIALLRSKPWLVLSVLLCMYLLNYSTIIILRPLIVFGFSVGLAISIFKIQWRWVDRLWMLWLWLALLMTMYVIALNAGHLPQLELKFAQFGYDAGESLLYPLTRLFGALAVWSMALRLSDTGLMHWSRKLEPVLFVAFCSHPLLFSVLQKLAGLILSDAKMQLIYPLWFLLAPVVALLIAQLGMRVKVFFPESIKARNDTVYAHER